MTTPRKSTRPQAKTAARRAFEAYHGKNLPFASTQEWLDWQAAWRTARGAKPTTREKAV